MVTEPVQVRIVEGDSLPVTLVASDVAVSVRIETKLQGFPVEIVSVRNCEMGGLSRFSSTPCVGVFVGE